MAKKKQTMEELLKEALVPEEEQPYEVPENWVWTNINSLFQLNMGQSPKGEHTTNDSNYTPLVGGPADMGEFFPKATRYTKKATKLSSKNELIVSIRATIGKTNISDGEYCLGRGVAGLKSNIISTTFLSQYFMTIETYLNSISTGSTFKQISRKGIEGTPFPLPPLNEQKRIADKVERLLNKIDEAKQLIEEAKKSFELRRAAILDKAFRGELTREWREDNIVLQRKINHTATDDVMFTLPNSWSWRNAENLFFLQPRNGYSPKSTLIETNTKTIKLGAITKGYFKREEFKFIEEIIDKDSYLWLKKGDFLIQRANSIDYVGTAAIYTGDDFEYIYPDLIMKGRLNLNFVIPEYMVLWTNSHFGKRYIKSNATGTAGNMPKINQKVIKNMPVPLPPVEEQKEIIMKLNKINNDLYKDTLNVALDYLNFMKQSILSKAFKGHLGTNDPSEENAIELLKEVLETK
ncbi:restriction endonuclease subunit S [Bacillus sp. Marseille-P3800]|uniref:restriction endonuclease subunit S n=1 Tax=Bacillus sp. Marseille-P3800 TaxID=2014782 RepID=UPI000C071663|nr:restriction endonuclease subunit S [Bacillus sp. Marseille-P3800]